MCGIYAVADSKMSGYPGADRAAGPSAHPLADPLADLRAITASRRAQTNH